MLLLTHQNGEEGGGGYSGQLKQLEEAMLRLRKQNGFIYRELQAAKTKPWWKRLLG